MVTVWKKKFNLRQKIFIYFLLLFLFFALGIVIFQQYREAKFRETTIEDSLQCYADILAKNGFDSIGSLLPVLPEDLRITLINSQGKVLYDNSISISDTIENHLQRPEIVQSKKNGKGTAVRYSKTTGQEYLYFAKTYGNRFLRVALPYDLKLKEGLRPDKAFLGFVLVMFLAALIFVIYLSNMFGQEVSSLRDFINSIEKNLGEQPIIAFPQTELGEISTKIVRNYRQLQKKQQQLNAERDKLIRHIDHSDNGIAIFSDKMYCVYANTHFIHYMGLILDKPPTDFNELFSHPEFSPLTSFLQNLSNGEPVENVVYTNHYNGHYFEIRAVLLSKDSFEITIRDITGAEKNRLLKQEMTGNIAHELRTPVSSISGYIETLLSMPVDVEKQQFFLKRAQTQVSRLSDLIRDIAMITKMEERSSFFHKETLSLGDTLNEVMYDLQQQLEASGDKMLNHLADDLMIEGNKTLIYALFRNLTENSIHYAGKGITITVDKYMEDADFYYLSFSDNGSGVEEKHLKRLFERFYRADSGRTRGDGGSGLGLSIVKNAVLLHGGEISAKVPKEGGLKFLITLRKKA